MNRENDQTGSSNCLELRINFYKLKIGNDQKRGYELKMLELNFE